MDVIQNFVLSHFLSVKAAHIISAFLWSFTTISPMLFYVNPTMKKLKANPDDPELKRRGEWVLEQMDRVVILEHIALAVLLITGLMLYASGVASFASGWFFAKMLIVVGFFVPMEIYDIWLTHAKAPRMERNKEADRPKYEAFRKFYYKYLTRLAYPIVVFIPAVLILALTKPF